jgi:transcriptional regulator GlxA family with amidase domain
MSDLVPPNVIPVAVLLDEGATIIDFAGPWDAFKAAADEKAEFHIFAVAPTRPPIQMMGGLTLLPDYTFEDAPLAKVVVIPAQGGGRDPAKLEWIRTASGPADRGLGRKVMQGAWVENHRGNSKANIS